MLAIAKFNFVKKNLSNLGKGAAQPIISKNNDIKNNNRQVNK